MTDPLIVKAVWEGQLGAEHLTVDSLRELELALIEEQHLQELLRHDQREDVRVFIPHQDLCH